MTASFEPTVRFVDLFQTCSTSLRHCSLNWSLMYSKMTINRFAFSFMMVLCCQVTYYGNQAKLVSLNSCKPIILCSLCCLITLYLSHCWMHEIYANEDCYFFLQHSKATAVRLNLSAPTPFFIRNPIETFPIRDF